MTHPTAEALDYGYAFEPDSAPDRPGYHRLTVVLRPAPTLEHYDPESVDVPVVTPHGDLETLTVYHPWTADQDHRAGAGRVILSDRHNKHVVAFTFGGALRIDDQPERVVVRLESPAPILALQVYDSVSYRLANAVEGLLARRRAALDMLAASAAGAPHSHRFDERLARAAPVPLYQACLRALDDWLAADCTLNAEADHRLEHFVSVAREAAGGGWRLEDLV
jgi:hypothetical protein